MTDNLHPLIHCASCGREFRNALYPIHCRCGVITHNSDNATFPDVLNYSVQSNAWEVIHYHLADAIYSGNWDAEAEIRWYENEWLPTIPGCGKCRAHWTELTSKRRIDWQTASAAYRCLIDLHNIVSEQHSGKPTITHVQADEIYLWKPSLNLVAVTSLSLLANHRAVQSQALQSWRRFGMTVHAVNSPPEIEQLMELYPEVDQWHASVNCNSLYRKPTQRIKSLTNVAIELQRPVLLINSDIEIHGSHDHFAGASNMVGVRHDYNEFWWRDSKPFAMGMDAFLISPEVAQSLPESPLEIGKPVWDYWLPWHLKTTGVAAKWIREPLFYHRRHRVNWSREDWETGADWLNETYGTSLAVASCDQFRSQFPPAKIQ